MKHVCSCSVCANACERGCPYECAVLADKAITVCGWCAVMHGQAIVYTTVLSEAA